MRDARIENLAKILVNYSTRVQPGETVMIYGHVQALPLVEAVYREVFKAGGLPINILEDDDLTYALFETASDEQLDWVSPVVKQLYETVDVLIRILAHTNTRVLSGVDPQRQQRYFVARRGLTKTYMQRTAEGKMRWVLTQLPCQAYAMEADMSLREYEDFVYKATFADQPDPIRHWQRIHDEQQRLVDWLAGKREVVVKGPNADLKLSIAGRKFINSDGTRNMPSGEIFTGPVEESAEGWIRFTYPAIRQGNVVEGVEFKFEKGKVVSAGAKINNAYLQAMLDSDEGARYLGEFAIGTNYAIQRFTKTILYDEKIGGTIHLAVGAGIPETGSINESSIHWDFICDMREESEIWVDGELLYKNGKFVI